MRRCVPGIIQYPGNPLKFFELLAAFFRSFSRFFLSVYHISFFSTSLSISRGIYLDDLVIKKKILRQAPRNANISRKKPSRLWNNLKNEYIAGNSIYLHLEMKLRHINPKKDNVRYF